MLHQALFEIDGPVAVRYPRGGEGVFNADTSTQATVRLKDGRQAVLITYGTLVEQALSAAEELERSGISTRVVKLNRIAPLDTAAILRETEGAETVLILEDCFENGSVGQQLAAAMEEAGQCFAPEGTVDQLRHRFGLDADGVVKTVKEAMSCEQ